MNKGRSLSRNRTSITCYNCYKKGHMKKDCRSPTYCQSCRQEHKPGSVECKNSWKYGQLNREHTKDRGNNYRLPQNDAYRGRNAYRQNYRPRYENRQRYQNNFGNESENFDRVNTLKAQAEEQRSDNYEEVHDWNVVNDFEEYEKNFH